MKFIFCTDCKDVVYVNPRKKKNICRCNGSYAKQKGKKIVYEGNVIPFGANTRSFVNALHDRPDSGVGRTFDAFVYPKNNKVFINAKDLDK